MPSERDVHGFLHLKLERLGIRDATRTIILQGHRFRPKLLHLCC
jgi:hypothetical protein